jgi:pimeloyl-ACP methyl ester carboxylesterase
MPAAPAGTQNPPDPLFHTCRVQGRQVHYLDTHPGAQRPTLLIVHGFLGSSYPYLKLALLLSEHVRVVVPDLPGFGRSEPPAGEADLDGYVGMLTEFAAVVGLERFAVLGSSLGAVIGTDYTLAAPETVEKLILCSPYGLEAQGDNLKTLTRWDPLLPPLSALITRARIRRVLRRRVVVNEAVITPELVDSYARPFASRAGRRVVVQVLRTMVAGCALDEQLSLLELPVLVILGEGDYLSGSEELAEFPALLCRGEVVVLAGCGHLFIYEEPEAAAALILRFLETPLVGNFPP